MRHIFRINKFRGEKQITSLPVFPSWRVDSSDGGKVKELLRNLGEKYYKILRNIPAHQYYLGICWDLEVVRVERAERGITGNSRSRRMHKPDLVNLNYFAMYYFLTIMQEYTGEIVIDWDLLKPQRRRRDDYPYDERVFPIEGLSEDENSESEEVNSNGSIILNPKCSRSDFRSITPNDYTELSTHHYFLLPRRLTGYAIGQK
jgi:hypothetical protein